MGMAIKRCIIVGIGVLLQILLSLFALLLLGKYVAIIELLYFIVVIIESQYIIKKPKNKIQSSRFFYNGNLVS